MKAEELIKASLEELLRIDSEGGKPSTSNSRLIFPTTRDGEQRVSEQEARFLFARELENQTDFYYSVEAPTAEMYRFSGVPEPRIDPTGQSGNTDVCLYKKVGNEYEREHLIEFKAHNVEADFKKDFLKLKYENNGKPLTNYFVHILKKFDAGTVKRLKEKYTEAFAVVEKSKNVENSIEIALCILSEKQILFLNENNLDAKLNNLIKK